MPGPVSDSYDAEFGTGANASDVRSAVADLVNKISRSALKDQPLKDILAVVHGKGGRLSAHPLSEKEWRIIRFALNRAIETI